MPFSVYCIFSCDSCSFISVQYSVAGSLNFDVRERPYIVQDYAGLFHEQALEKYNIFIFVLPVSLVINVHEIKFQ